MCFAIADGVVNGESKGVSHSYGARHTEMTLTETLSDGQPADATTDELQKTEHGGLSADLYLHKNGSWCAGILYSHDGVMTTKKMSKVKYIDGRKVKFSGQNNQKKMFRVVENKADQLDKRHALVPVNAHMFTHRIRTGRTTMHLNPEHPLHACSEFLEYCADMDKQLFQLLEGDLRKVEDFEYFKAHHNVLTIDNIIPHLRANKHEVHQVDKEERAIDFLACDIATAVSYPHRRAAGRGVQQAVLSQANQDQIKKNAMGVKLAAIVLERDVHLPQKLLADFGMPRLVQGGRGKTTAAADSSKRPREARGRPVGATTRKKPVTDLTRPDRPSRKVKNTAAVAKQLAMSGKAMPGAQNVIPDKVATDLPPPKPTKGKGGSPLGYASDSTMASMGSDLSSMSTNLHLLQTKVEDLPELVRECVKISLDPMLQRVKELEAINADLVAKVATAEANAKSYEKECGKWEDQLKCANDALHKAVQAAMSRNL